MHRIAVVKQGAEGLRTSFVEAMQELGYVEGQNLLIETRGTKGDNQKFPSLIAELIATKPDVIVAETTVGALAAKRATSTIPIVMLNVSDPVGSGLVTSLGHPGGNVTGTTDHGLALADKSVDLVRAIAPSSVRLGVLMPDGPVQPSQFERIRAAADRISLSVLSFHVGSLEDLDRTFAAMVAQKVDAFIALGGAPLNSTWQQVDTVIAMAARARLPAVYGFSDAVIRGGLMSYATSLDARWKLAATYVDRIIKGTRPADLPVRQPTTFELFINRKTAASLKLTIPPALLLQADRIIS